MPPSFLLVNLIPTQAYNYNSGEVFADSINVIYEEIIGWRNNIFLLPSGQYGKKLSLSSQNGLANIIMTPDFKELLLKD